MPFKELRGLLAQVITSWQVLAVTIVVVLYFFLISYVAELYRRPRAPSIPRPPRPARRKLRIGFGRKKGQAGAEGEGTAEADELGLEKD